MGSLFGVKLRSLAMMDNMTDTTLNGFIIKLKRKSQGNFTLEPSFNLLE